MPNRERVTVAGVGMTRFAKHPDRSLADLAGEAIGAALNDVPENHFVDLFLADAAAPNRRFGGRDGKVGGRKARKFPAEITERGTGPGKNDDVAVLHRIAHIDRHYSATVARVPAGAVADRP